MFCIDNFQPLLLPKLFKLCHLTFAHLFILLPSKAYANSGSGTLCSNEWVMKIGTDRSQKLNNEYLIYPVMGNEVKMNEIWVIINGRVMGMVLFCGSIMTID